MALMTILSDHATEGSEISIRRMSGRGNRHCPVLT